MGRRERARIILRSTKSSVFLIVMPMNWSLFDFKDIAKVLPETIKALGELGALVGKAVAYYDEKAERIADKEEQKDEKNALPNTIHNLALVRGLLGTVKPIFQNLPVASRQKFEHAFPTTEEIMKGIDDMIAAQMVATEIRESSRALIKLWLGVGYSKSLPLKWAGWKIKGTRTGEHTTGGVTQKIYDEAGLHEIGKDVTEDHFFMAKMEVKHQAHQRNDFCSTSELGVAPVSQSGPGTSSEPRSLLDRMPSVVMAEGEEKEAVDILTAKMLMDILKDIKEKEPSAQADVEIMKILSKII